MRLEGQKFFARLETLLNSRPIFDNLQPASPGNLKRAAVEGVPFRKAERIQARHALSKHAALFLSCHIASTMVLLDFGVSPDGRIRAVEVEIRALLHQLQDDSLTKSIVVSSNDNGVILLSRNTIMPGRIHRLVKQVNVFPNQL